MFTLGKPAKATDVGEEDWVPSKNLPQTDESDCISTSSSDFVVSLEEQDGNLEDSTGIETEVVKNVDESLHGTTSSSHSCSNSCLDKHQDTTQARYSSSQFSSSSSSILAHEEDKYNDCTDDRISTTIANTEKKSECSSKHALGGSTDCSPRSSNCDSNDRFSNDEPFPELADAMLESAKLSDCSGCSLDVNRTVDRSIQVGGRKSVVEFTF